MSVAVQFYVATLLVYVGVDTMLAWGFNLQYGLGGTLNLAFVVFEAVGGYTVAVLTLGPSSGNGGFESYIVGLSLPFPIPVLIAALCGAASSALVGFVVLKRLRSDYLALALLVMAVIATQVVVGAQGLFNGQEGLYLVPQPLMSRLGLSSVGYQWAYVGWTAIVTLAVYLVVRRLKVSPFGRALRAARDHEDAAQALGRNVFRMRLTAFVLGGAIAATAGAVLVEYISAWSPGSWLYTEGIVVMACVVVGGTGNNLGAMLGALLIPVTFSEITRLIPTGTLGSLIEPIQEMVIGLLILTVLWVRPQGLVPERRRRFPPRVEANRGDATEGVPLRGGA